MRAGMSRDPATMIRYFNVSIVVVPLRTQVSWAATCGAMSGSIRGRERHVAGAGVAR